MWSTGCSIMSKAFRTDAMHANTLAICSNTSSFDMQSTRWDSANSVITCLAMRRSPAAMVPCSHWTKNQKTSIRSRNTTETRCAAALWVPCSHITGRTWCHRRHQAICPHRRPQACRHALAHRQPVALSVKPKTISVCTISPIIITTINNRHQTRWSNSRRAIIHTWRVESIHNTHRACPLPKQIRTIRRPVSTATIQVTLNWNLLEPRHQLEQAIPYLDPFYDIDYIYLNCFL